MKIRNILVITAIGLVLLNSCEKLDFGNNYLEKAPGEDVTIDTIFNSIELAERFLWGAYSTLPYGLNVNWDANRDKLGQDLLESLSDLSHSFLAWGGINRLYYPGQYTAATENSSSKTKYHFSKERNWEGIRKAWIFIENANRIPDASQEYKEQLKAEARMVIALHYTDMFRHYGGLPWINKAYYPNESTDVPRMFARATMDSISGLIDRAATDLPWQIEDIENWDGRFTRAGALGLKARLLLFGASPLFNSDEPYLAGEASDKEMTWYGAYDATMWQDAADAAKELIDEIAANGNNYTLINTGYYRQDFQDAYYKRGNGEVLISTRVRFQSPGLWSNNYYFYQSAGRYGTACPSQEYVDMFGMSDGSSFSITNPLYDPVNPWANRDPRLYETVLINGDSYQGRTAELWIGGRERKSATFKGTKSGYGMRKFLLEQNDATSYGSVVHWPYLRLPEIYLSYAEALNEANAGPTAEAYNFANLVRQRVGLSELPAGLTQEEFREAILNERACEFGYEEVRWFDLVRWKRDADLRKVLHGTNTFDNGDGSFSYEQFELPERHWQNNWSPKWYLSAFPPDEVNKAYGLVQNPGWE